MEPHHTGAKESGPFDDLPRGAVGRLKDSDSFKAKGRLVILTWK